MACTKALNEVSDAEVLNELARRDAGKLFREGTTMTEMELAVEAMVGTHREPSIRPMAWASETRAPRQLPLRPSRRARLELGPTRSLKLIVRPA